MENKKLRICHVITRMIVGGAQENTLLTIKGHLANGHHVELATGPSPVTPYSGSKSLCGLHSTPLFTSRFM